MNTALYDSLMFKLKSERPDVTKLFVDMVPSEEELMLISSVALSKESTVPNKLPKMDSKNKDPIKGGTKENFKRMYGSLNESEAPTLVVAGVHKVVSKKTLKIFKTLASMTVGTNAEIQNTAALLLQEAIKSVAYGNEEDIYSLKADKGSIKYQFIQAIKEV